MKYKWVGRYDPSLRMFRLLRLMWVRGDVGTGGYSAKFSVTLRPVVWHWRTECGGWLLTIFGIRLHFQKSWGGVHV